MFFTIFVTATAFFTKKVTIMRKIWRATTVTPELFEGINRLLPQLSTSANPLSPSDIERLLANDSTHLYIAEIDGKIVGMLSLVVVDIPTGLKVWIEDVVVDKVARGLHIGHALVERAKAEAESLGARKIYLTSNPSRKAAHALYRKCGFEHYDTTLFRIIL